MNSNIKEGGCLCGKVRYQIDLKNHQTGNCHCKDCQRQAGAPFVPFTSVDAVQFKWVSKPDGEYRATEKAVRRFCTSCGSLLTWEGVDFPQRKTIVTSTLDVMTATLDKPEDIPITYEIFTKNRWKSIPPVPGAEQFFEDNE